MLAQSFHSMNKLVLVIILGLAIVLVLLVAEAGLMLARTASIRAYTRPSLLELLVQIEAIAAVGILLRATLHRVGRSRM